MSAFKALVRTAPDVGLPDVSVRTGVPELRLPAGYPLSSQIVTPPDRKGVIPYRITISFSRHFYFSHLKTSGGLAPP